MDYVVISGIELRQDNKGKCCAVILECRRYRTNPHVDQADVARKAAVIFAHMAKCSRFHMAFLRPPLTPSSVTLPTHVPGAYAERVRDAARLTDPEGAIVNATVLGGFVYSGRSILRCWRRSGAGPAFGWMLGRTY